MTTQVQPVYAANQTRLVRLREYRSRIVNDVQARTAQFIVDVDLGKTVPVTFTLFAQKAQERVRLINAEIDRLLAS